MLKSTPCRRCGTEFTPQRSYRERFCSDECRRLQQQESRRQSVLRTKARLRAERSTRSEIAFVECAWAGCGEVFVRSMAKRNLAQRYCEDHRGAARARNRTNARRSEAAKEQRSRGRLARFSMTQDDYDAMLAQQGGGCAICGTTDTGRFKVFAVDHDHSCCPGQNSCGRCVRGLLCGACNGGIGLLRDDTSIIAAALDYLRAHAATRPDL